MMISIRRRLAATALASGLLAVAGAAWAMPPFGPWSAPDNLANLPGTGPGISTPAVDGCASLSRDGLTLIFNSNRTGNFELYVATRPDTSSGFGSPRALPAPVNGPANESCATFGPGNRLYFASDRDDPAYDLYVTKKGPNGWSTPHNLGPNINRPGWLEESPAFYEAGGHEIMLYSARRPDGTDGEILESVDGAPAKPVGGGPYSSASDNRPSITRDGLTIFFDSDRYGTLGGPDIFYATRSSTSEDFGPAIHIDAVNSPGFDARPFISFDGQTLLFSSARPGNPSPAPDMWYSTRIKAVGR